MILADIIISGKIPEDKRSKHVILDPDEVELLDKTDTDMPSLKCLGLVFNPDSDTLQFMPHQIPDMKGWTKRQVVSYVAKVFDPEGHPYVPLLQIELVANGRMAEWDGKVGW